MQSVSDAIWQWPGRRDGLGSGSLSDTPGPPGPFICTSSWTFLLPHTGGAVGLGLIFLLLALVLWIFGMTNSYHAAEEANQQDLARL
jgi:hypothetical protein